MRLLVFRIGNIGDSLVSLPAIWAIKKAFPSAELFLLTESSKTASFASAWSVLRETGLFKDCLSYVKKERRNTLIHLLSLFITAIKIRRFHFDKIFYLAPSPRTEIQINRDRNYFNWWCGIHEIIGDFPLHLDLSAEKPLKRLAHESDNLLSRIQSMVNISDPTRRMDLNIQLDEIKHCSDRFSSDFPDHRNQPWIAIGPGSKMPSKKWPLERYLQVLQRLMISHNVWPVIFGSSEDKEQGDTIITSLRMGRNLAGKLSIRESAALLSQFDLYLGNDTGTMHLAASTGISCIAIFSARDYPGLWYPYGSNIQLLENKFRAKDVC